MLSRCGTVIATDRGQSIIKVDQERCDNCVGLCIRFGVPDEFASEELFELGQRVRVVASSKMLTYASCTVFGLPVVCFLLAYLMSNQLASASVGFCIGLLVGLAVCRMKFIRSRLTMQVELQDSRRIEADTNLG